MVTGGIWKYYGDCAAARHALAARFDPLQQVSERARARAQTLAPPLRSFAVAAACSADENFDGRYAVNFVVQHTGDIMHAPPAIVKSSCSIDITWFPVSGDYFCAFFRRVEIHFFAV